MARNPPMTASSHEFETISRFQFPGPFLWSWGVWTSGGLPQPLLDAASSPSLCPMLDSCTSNRAKLVLPRSAAAATEGLSACAQRRRLLKKERKNAA